MTAMTVAAAIPASLPTLAGKLLWAYRFVWCGMAVGALAVVVLAAVQGTAPAAILAVRLTKAFIVGAVAIILFCRRPRDPVAAILALAFLCWIISSSFDFNSGELLPVVLDRLRFFLFALALLLFPDSRWTPGWTRHLAAASAAAFVIGIGEAVGLLNTRLFLQVAIFCILAAIASLVQRYRMASDVVQEQQLKWVALGLVAGVGAILTARAGAATIAVAGSATAFEILFQLGIMLIAIGFLAPLVRYRLYDAETVISRSAAYAGLTVALVATFAGSEALIATLGQQFLGAGVGDLSGAIAAAVAAMLLTPLHRRISDWADARFQADLVQLKSELPELLSDMPAAWSPEQVGAAALPRIAQAIHASRIALIFDGETIATHGVAGSGTAGQTSYSLSLPLRCPFGGVRGRLCLGPRPDGSLYGSDERGALDEILPPLRRRLASAADRTVDRLQEENFRNEFRVELGAIDARLVELEETGCHPS